jgi:hypothetical protein
MFPVPIFILTTLFTAFLTVISRYVGSNDLLTVTGIVGDFMDWLLFITHHFLCIY